MPRNYDTTGHKLYPRVTEVNIKYSTTGESHTEYTEQMAVVDGDNNVQHIDASASRHVLDFGSISEPVQLVNPATGEPIPGQFVTKQQVMLSLLAFLRADQLRRDQA